MSQHHRDAHWSREAPKWRKRLAALLPLPCLRCGHPVYPEQKWDVDHLLPISEGGAFTTENTGASHSLCNRRHGGQLGARITNEKRDQAYRNEKRFPKL